MKFVPRKNNDGTFPSGMMERTLNCTGFCRSDLQVAIRITYDSERGGEYV